MLKDCIKKLGKRINSVDREDLEAGFEKYRAAGQSEYDASMSALGDYHKTVFDAVNEVRRHVGQKPAVYEPFNAAPINEKYAPKAPAEPAEPVTHPLDDLATEAEKPTRLPKQLVGQTVDIGGGDTGRIAEIRDGKFIVDHQPRTVGGQTLYGKRSFFQPEDLSINGVKLSEYKPPKPPKQTGEATFTQENVPTEETAVDESVFEKHRAEGKYTVDGVTYTRNPELKNGPLGELGTLGGNKGRVKFSNEDDPEFQYQLLEADQLTPADLGGKPNRQHFLPEAQPKDRSNKASRKASDEIAANIDLTQLSDNRLAYSGAPVVNTRGEVIQGNNRSEGIIKHYGSGRGEYKEQLVRDASKFGFTPSQIEGMKKPVLVRMVNADDNEAIRLGNLDVKDIETGSGIGINPVNTAARIPYQTKFKILGDVFAHAPENSTMNQLVRDRSDKIANHLKPYVTEQQWESLFRPNTTELLPQGVKDVERLFQHFLFDKGDPQLADLFDALPYQAREATVRSLPKIFGVPQEKSLVPDIQNGIMAAKRFEATGIPNFDDWSKQADMFDAEQTPAELYTPVELAIAKTFVESTSQAPVREMFNKYLNAANGTQATLVEPATEPMSKAAAVKHVFNVNYEAKPYVESKPEDTAGSEPAEGSQTETETATNAENTATGVNVGAENATTENAAKGNAVTEPEPEQTGTGLEKPDENIAAPEILNEDELGDLFDDLTTETPEEKSAEPEKQSELNTLDLAHAVAAHFATNGSFKNINEARQFVKDRTGIKIEPGTPEAKTVDEAIELGVVLRARQIAAADGTDEEKYDRLVKLYDDQPNLSVRTSTSVENQAYSTPAPLAFIASRLAGINDSTRVKEPTAGNGMLLMEANPSRAVVNEIDPERAANLEAQGFRVTQVDATNLAAPANSFDVVIANPPFSAVKNKYGQDVIFPIHGAYQTNQIDHAIVFKALESMRDDGRAVLIVGGVKGESRDSRFNGYQVQAKRGFYFNLYNEYNVVDHFTVDGDLYKKQGAGFPVDVIVIDGRGKSSRTLPAGDLPKIYKSWNDLKEKLADAYNAGFTTDETDQRPLGGLDAEQRPQQQNGTGDTGTSGPAIGPRPISELPRRPRKNPRKSGTGTRSGPVVSDTGATGQQPAGGRDFSDASEHGLDANNGEPAGEKPGTGETGGVAKGNAGEQLASGQSDQGNQSGELANGTPSVKPSETDLNDAIRGLDDLFDDNTMLSIVPEQDPGLFAEKPAEAPFNEELYAKAKPHFQKAYDYFKDEAKDAKGAMLQLLNYLREKANWTNDKLRKMKAYIVRFVSDLQRQMTQTRQRQERVEVDPQTAATSAQLPYVPQSAGQSMDTLLPANLYNATVNALEKLEAEVGNIDDYAAGKMGYNVKSGEIYQHFGGEQIDAIALAISNIENGSALILGDQTGVGKGRVVAGIIKYAQQIGKVPIFMSEKKNLYKDIYRDLLDIGMNDVRPLMTDANEKIALTDADNDSDKVWLKTGSGHNKVLQKMMNDEAIDPKYNVIFTTYYAIQLPLPRREFLRQFADNNIIIMDESHNAGGDGVPKVNSDGTAVMNRSRVAREMVQNSQGILYSSATWAKRPDVMDLYSKTDMRLAVADINQLAGAIEAGGVPLQQAVSAMLAESGQYLRRERSFEGISYDTTKVEVDKQKVEEFGDSIKKIYDFSQAVRDHVKDSPEIWASGSALLRNPAINAEATNFSALMHNIIAQALLAMKVDKAAQEAIDELKAGHKPVLTFSNTMGAMIDEAADQFDWSPGDVVNLDFGQVLLRYLEKSRTVTVKDANGNKVKFRLTDAQLGPQLARVHDQAKQIISGRDWSNLPASPVDYMISKLEAAGYKVKEITGRSSALQYNQDGTVIYRHRPAKDRSVTGKNDAILAFNNGDEADVMLLNRSGSTGLSLHASEKFKDQRQRTMLIVQAEANIDTHMQMLGRVNRTGQVIAPAYKQLAADIPAEFRPAAVLAKKMASLNANTTGAVDSAVTAKETLDFINMYGDAVVYQYLVDNRDIDDLLGNPAANSGSSPASLDMATKATGKLPMLSLAQQEEFYEAVSSAYTNLIDQLNQTGENRLEAQTLPLEAITHSRIKVFNGPGGESPFAADAYAEDVEVKKLTKPLSQAEVMNNLRAKLEMPDATLPQMERKGGEVMNQFLRSLQPEVNTYIEAELDKLVDANKIGPARTRLNGLWSRLQGSLRYAPIGTTIKVEMGRETYYGVVADVRKMGRSSTPLALSDYEVTVYTTDASRRLHIPASRIYTPMNPAPSGAEMSATFQRASRQESFMGTFTPIIEAFDHGQNVRTERRTIIAGNLLAGYGQFALGRVVNFTMKDGRLRQGILMPANFNVGTAIQDMPVKFANIDQVMQFLATLNTSTSQGRLVEDQTGNVRVTNLRGDHTLSVPGSKAQGARYFLNTDIRRAAGGRDFVRSGQSMMLRLGRDTATMQRVLEEMSKQGVEFQTNSFKDAARDITGEKLPETEIIPQDTAPNPGFEQAQNDREADENDLHSIFDEEMPIDKPDGNIGMMSLFDRPLLNRGVNWKDVDERLERRRLDQGPHRSSLFDKPESEMKWIGGFDNLNNIADAAATEVRELLGPDSKAAIDEMFDVAKIQHYSPSFYTNDEIAPEVTANSAEKFTKETGLALNPDRTITTQHGRTYVFPTWDEMLKKVSPGRREELLAKEGPVKAIYENTIQSMRSALKRAADEGWLNADYRLSNKGEAYTPSDIEMYSLIGEHGASNLPDARGRLANLNIAKQMDEGGQYDANRIWLATGWEKGKEGKWKTEIDSNLFDIKDSKAKTLGEALHAPELFKAYPELKDVNVSINQKGVGQIDTGTRGSFNQQTNTITISEGSNFTTFSTLQHEIQHAIQYIEGFAVGTNWRQFMPAAFHQDVSALSDDEYNRAITNARDRYHRTAGEVEARNVQFRNDLSPAEKKRTSPGESEDVPRQRQIVLYESEMAAMATQEMMSIADAEKEETDRQNAVKLLKAVPLSELTPSVNFNAQGDRIKINLPAMELLRRGFEQVDIDGGKRRFGKEETYPSFLGLFDDGKKLSKVADVLDKNGGVQAQQLAAAIRDALKISNTAVFYVSDAKLPQELFHQAVYIVSVEKGLTKRHADAQKLDSSPQVAKADKYFFSKQGEYQIDNIMRTKGLNRQQAANFRKAIIREETAAWTAEGNWADIGLTEDEGYNYLLDFMKSLHDKVYQDQIKLGKSPAEAKTATDAAFQRFKEIDYAKEAVESVLAGQATGVSTSYGDTGTGNIKQEDTGGPAQGAEGTPQNLPGQEESEGIPALGDYNIGTRSRIAGDASELGVRGKREFASLPGTMRRNNIASDEVIYTVFGDRAAQQQAQHLFNELGVDGVADLLNNIADPDVHHAIASFVIQRMLWDEAARVEDTNPAQADKLRKQSLDMAAKIAMKMVRAGRFIRAASIIAKTVQGMLATAQALYQQQYGMSQQMPKKQRERIEQKAKQAESAMAQHEALVKQMDALKRELADLKRSLLGNGSLRQASAKTMVGRQKLVRQVQARHKVEVDNAIQRLKSLALIKSTYGVAADGSEENGVFSIFDQPTLPADLLNDFASVGGNLLLEGLAAPSMMKPGDFDEQMAGLYGEEIRPHLEAIHREALRRRNQWLSDLVKENELKGVIKEFGESLSDQEIEDIIQERHDALLRRGAIMRLHNLRAEKGKKVADLSDIEALIAEIAPNPAAAAAATEMIHSKPSAHELYRTLEQLGFTGKEARDAFREGSDTLEKAKMLHKKRKAEAQEETRKRIAENEDEMKEISDLVKQSRVRARESQIEIEKELKRIATGEVGFYKNLAVEALNTPRAVMASTDLSFIFRQGGWFMFARPRQQAKALGAMMDAFGEKIGRVGFDQAMADMEKNDFYELAVRSGLDFAGLGKHGEFSITKGEEEFRNNVFGLMADYTKHLAEQHTTTTTTKTESGETVTKTTAGAAGLAHGLNIARVPNAIIKKSDEIYTAFLDAQRLAAFADSADYFTNKLGLSFEENPKEFRALAEYINDATGRSSVPGGQGVANLLMNLPLFAPRFTVSRFKLMYKSTLGLPFLPPQTRKVVMRDAAQVYVILGGLVALAWMAGMSAGLDWDDDDFLKIKIGNNHIDPFMGMQQNLRPMVKLAALAVRGAFGYPRKNLTVTNKQGDTTTSEVYNSLFDLRFGEPAKFIRRKLSPIPSLPIDYLIGEDAIGQPFSWTNALISRSVPLGVQEVAKQVYGGDPVSMLLATGSLSGYGYSNYPDQAERATTDAEKLAQKLGGIIDPSPIRTQASKAAREKRTAIMDKERDTGDKVEARNALNAMVEAGEITARSRDLALKGLREPFFDSQIARLPAQALSIVKEVANPDEKAQIETLLTEKQAKADKLAARAEARQQLYGEKEPKPKAPEKPLGEKLKRADVEESLLLYQENQAKLTSEQRFDALKAVKRKVLDSHQRGTLTQENYDAAKKILGDELKFQFVPRPKRPVRSKQNLTSLNNVY